MRKTKAKNTLVITCCNCQAKSSPVQPTSPAAPMLTALEQLKPLGWSYQVGFFSMMTGNYSPLCSACTAAAQAKGKAQEVTV